MLRLATLSLFACAALALGDDAEPVKKKLDDKKAEKAVKDYLEKVKATGGTSKKIDDKTVDKALPSHHFYHLLFRQYPVGRIPPEGLKSSNVLAVGPDGKVQALTSVAEMEKFFKNSLKGLTGAAKMGPAASAFLRLGQELYQDGFYTFERDKTGKVGTGTGDDKDTSYGMSSSATKGGKGKLELTMTFDSKGAIKSAKIDSTLRPGPRPICQATKLLDPDPIVRQMAEQLLLVMGRSAKEYLQEQRKKASPELKRAIDRMWWLIVQDDKE